MNMRKKTFNVSYRPQIESGEMKVVNGRGKPVTILKWDMQGNYPILGVVMTDQTNWEGDESWEEERPFAYTNEGYACASAPADRKELYVITEEQGSTPDWCNPSEFDSRLNALLKEFESLPKEEMISSLGFYLREVGGKDPDQGKVYPTLDRNSLLSTIWHKAVEEPEPGRELITRNAKGIKIYPNPKNSHTSWEFFRRIAKVDFWAYSDEILPEAREEAR